VVTRRRPLRHGRGPPPYRDLEIPAATLAAVLNEPVVPPRHAGPLALAINGLLRKDPLERTDDPVVRKVLNRIIGEAKFGADATDFLASAGLRRADRRGAGGRATRPPAPAPASRRRAVSVWHRPLWRMTVRDRTVAWTPAGLTVAAVALLVAFTTAVTVVMLDDRSPAASALPSPPERVIHRRSPSTARSASSTGERTVVIPKDFSFATTPRASPSHSPTLRPHRRQRPRLRLPLRRLQRPRSVLVDWTHSPGSDLVAAWQSLEKTVRAASPTTTASAPSESLDYRGWKAADWEWTSTINGVRYRTLNRASSSDSSTVTPSNGASPSSVWYAEANQQALQPLPGLLPARTVTESPPSAPS